MRYWVSLDEMSKMPTAFPQVIWPGIESARPTCSLAMHFDYELPYGEKAILAGAVRMTQPKIIFEFGTFTGSTTVLLADAASNDVVVHTIDQPDDSFPDGGFDGWFTPDLVGREFDNGRYADRIILHRVDLRVADLTMYEGNVDFVFVDAAHSYREVLLDSEIAFTLLAPGGTIVWDDYHAPQWGVVRALNELAESKPLQRIAYTRLVTMSN